MAEEHRYQAPEGHRPCINNCGFFGSPATMNLCSKCYGDYCLKEEEQQQQSIKSCLSSPPSSSSSSSLAPTLDSPTVPPVLISPEVHKPLSSSSSEPVTAVMQPNRCSMCRKRVGLTGFKCRCGITFCGVHRYPEKHRCSFDFKKVGREEIARANPVVIAEKLHKI